MAQVILVRHGATHLNHEDKDKDRIRGWKDIPLNAQGVKEANHLSKHFKDKKIDKIYSSDLIRAIATAKIINKEHGIKIQSTKELRPWGLGEFEGKITNEVLPELKEFIKDETKTPKDGESFKKFRTRVLMEIIRIIKEAKKEGLITLINTHYRDLKVAESWVIAGCPRDLSIDEKSMTKDSFGTGETYIFPIDKLSDTE